MKKELLYKKLKRNSWMVAVFLFTCWESINVAYAQSGGAEAINGATSEVKSYYDPVKKLVWIIAGVLGLVGAFKVYNKFTNSDPESSKNAVGFVGGAVALYAAEVFIRKMFME